MKRFLIAAMILLFAIGCGAPKEGTIILPYPKPADFDHFEVFVGLAPGFTVTGWDGAAWVGEPNAPADWDGVTNTLKVISSTEPIAIPGLIPGVRYYVRVVAVDTSNNRSAPSAQYDAVAGGAPRAATVIVAANDASPASKAGADYVCDGDDDAAEINAAFNSLPFIDIETGTARGGGINTILLDFNIASDFKDAYNGLTIEIREGAGAGQSKKIIDYDLAIKSAIVDSPWDEPIDNTSIYTIISRHGKVILTEGTFIIFEGNPVKMLSNTTLEGQGPEGTVVKFRDGIALPHTYAAIISNDDTTYGNVNIIIRDLTVDGNRDRAVNQLLQRGIFLDKVFQGKIYNVHAMNTWGQGIGLQRCKRVNVFDCEVKRAESYGGITLSGSNSVISDNKITKCHVSECRVAGISISAVSHNLISDCTIDRIQRDGIILENGSNENIVENNIVKNCSLETDNYYAGIFVQESSRNTIKGNTVRRSASGNQQNAGIWIDNGPGQAASNLVTNNDCYTGGKSYGTRNNGTNTMAGAGNINNAGAWSTSFS